MNVARLATVCAAVDTFLAAFIGRVGRPEEDPVTEELTRKWRVGKPPERESLRTPYSRLFLLFIANCSVFPFSTKQLGGSAVLEWREDF